MSHGDEGDLTRMGGAPALDTPAGRSWGEDEERALRVWIALARCYSTFSRSISGKVHEYGLTTPQFGILEALYHLGPLSLGDLAEKLLVTGGNVTYVMDRLEEQAFVYRERSPLDRRIIQAKLTEKGHAVMAEVFPGHGHFVEELCGALDHDEQETLRTLLKKLGRSIKDQG